MSDINELFSRDPLKMTDQDLDQIIQTMREKRKAFKSQPASAKSAPKLTEAQKKVSGLNLDLDL